MKAELEVRSGLLTSLLHLGLTMGLIAVLLWAALTYYPPLLGILSLILVIFILLTTIRYLVSLRAIFLRPAPVPDSDLPMVSVVVPAYNEASVLRRTIPEMLKVDYPYEKIEFLYIYESSCTDDTEAVIQEFASEDDRIRPLLRSSGNGGKAAATNDAIEEAQGVIIASFDADHELAPDAIRRAVSWFQDPEVMCVKGRCRGRNKGDNLLTLLSGMERDVVERLGIPSSYLLGGFSTFGGGHAYFRRSIFQDLGPFDEDIMTEDIEMSVRLHLAGHHVVTDPGITSWEELPDNLETFFHQRKRWARGWMQVWKKDVRKVVSSGMPLYRKYDTSTELTLTLGSAITVFFIPTMILNLFGPGIWIGPLWLHWVIMIMATATPTLMSWITQLLDWRQGHGLSWVAMIGSLFLVPYLFLLFLVNWLAFVDEFIIHRDPLYVKTMRNRDRTSA